MATNVVFIGTPEAVYAKNLADALGAERGTHVTIQDALVVMAERKANASTPPIVPVVRNAS